ncbi:MAG: hypothetical protein KGL39_28515 [Patescibacteria group bacterium]|nr:hypothetical protein [Patescibacteria group bacterium]
MGEDTEIKLAALTSEFHAFKDTTQGTLQEVRTDVKSLLAYQQRTAAVAKFKGVIVGFLVACIPTLLYAAIAHLWLKIGGGK